MALLGGMMDLLVVISPTLKFLKLCTSKKMRYVSLNYSRTIAGMI